MRANRQCAFQLPMFPKNNIPFAVTCSEQLERLAPLTRSSASVQVLVAAVDRIRSTGSIWFDLMRNQRPPQVVRPRAFLR